VSELSEMKPNLVDKTCKLLKWVCNYRKLHNKTTREQLLVCNSIIVSITQYHIKWHLLRCRTVSDHSYYY